MRRRQRWIILLSSAFFLSGIIPVIMAIYTYSHVMCNDQIMNPGDRCIHSDIYGNETGSYTIDQERQYWPITKEGLVALLCLAGGGWSLVYAFKVPASDDSGENETPTTGSSGAAKGEGTSEDNETLATNSSSINRVTAPNGDGPRPHTNLDSER